MLSLALDKSTLSTLNDNDNHLQQKSILVLAPPWSNAGQLLSTERSATIFIFF
jgi:hypothetical protein